MGDLLAVVYLLLANILFSRWPGLIREPFSAMGSSREMTVAAIAEPTIAVAIFSLALGAGSTNLGRIVTQALAIRPRRSALATFWLLLRCSSWLAQTAAGR